MSKEVEKETLHLCKLAMYARELMQVSPGHSDGAAFAKGFTNGQAAPQQRKANPYSGKKNLIFALGMTCARMGMDEFMEFYNSVVISKLATDSAREKFLAMVHKFQES